MRYFLLATFLLLLAVLLSVLALQQRALVHRPGHRAVRYSSTRLTISTTPLLDGVVATDPNVLQQRADAVVVGSGPAGLAAAIMLARRPEFTSIRLYDQLPEPPRSDDMNVWGNFKRPRSYNVGLSGRGQRVLESLNCLPRVFNASIAMTQALTWSPSTTDVNAPAVRDLRRARYQTVCLERDRLAACLLEELRNEYSDKVIVEFNCKCDDVEFLNIGTAEESCKVHLIDTAADSVMDNSSINSRSDSIKSIGSNSSSSGGQRTIVETAFVVGADGANSAVRDAMQRRNPQLQVQKFADTNVRVYRTIALHRNNSSSSNDISSNSAYTTDTTTTTAAGAEYYGESFTYSARTASAGINLEALPTREGVHLGVVLYRPNDPIIGNITSAEQALAFFQQYFPMFLPFIKPDDFKDFALKGDSYFPKFQFAGPQLHFGSSAVLVGDCIHTVKPYFGLGLNSAFEDVGELQRMLDDASKSNNNNNNGSNKEIDGQEEEIKREKDQQSELRGSALQQYSKQRSKQAKTLVTLSRNFDSSVLRFVLPLVIDSFFHRLLPAVFERSTLSMLQDERYSFTFVASRKLLDRLMQLTATAAVAVTAAQVARFLLQFTWRIGRKLLV